MSFWAKIKAGMIRFMNGRHGVDEFSYTLLITALVLMLFSSLFGSYLLNLVSLALYILGIYRMLSRNHAKRYEENRKFVAWKQKFTTYVSQAWVRLKNIKKFKYFKCPECGVLLRLPRKVGEVTVTCGKCKRAFRKKA